MTDAAHEVARELLDLLAARKMTLAVAESLTGGSVAAALVSVPGASAVFRGGVVAYATDLKQRLLGVDSALLDEHGAVHPEVARQMAIGVRALAARDGVSAGMGIATTGVAGPDPQDSQPVGTVFVAVATEAGARVEALELSGSRERIRADATHRALELGLLTARR